MKIQARKAAGKPFELSLILDWFVQLTNAVRYIHERCGIIFNTMSDCGIVTDAYYIVI